MNFLLDEFANDHWWYVPLIAIICSVVWMVIAPRLFDIEPHWAMGILISPIGWIAIIILAIGPHVIVIVGVVMGALLAIGNLAESKKRGSQ
jgi:hypothetical protein